MRSRSSPGPMTLLPATVCRPPSGSANTPIQRPLARRRVVLSRRVFAYYGLIRASGPLPTVSFSIGRVFACLPRTRGSPIYSAYPSFRAVFPARRVRRCLTVPTSADDSLRLVSNDSAPASPTQKSVHAWNIFRDCKVRFMLRPGKLLALHRQGLLRSSFHPIKSPRWNVEYNYAGKPVNSRGRTLTGWTSSIMGCTDTILFMVSAFPT
jgi:hypothetical protein